MQVTYQQTLDDWIAAQIFKAEQPKPFNDRNKRTSIRLFAAVSVFFVFMIVITSLQSGFDLVGWAVPILLFVCLCNVTLNYRSRRRKMLTQYCCDYAQEFTAQNEVQFSVTSTGICIRRQFGECRYDWASIRKVIVCRDFLFLYLGRDEYIWFGKQVIGQSQYHSLCEDVIHTYREHAAVQGDVAEVLHSDWTIDLENLLRQRPSRPWTCRRFLFSLLWAIVLMLVLTFFCGILMVAIAIAAVAMEERTTIDTAPWAAAVSFIWFFGSLLMLIGGMVLGYFAKLPGTKVHR